MMMHLTMCLQVAEVAAEALTATTLLAGVAPFTSLDSTLDRATGTVNRAMAQAALVLVPLDEPATPPISPVGPPKLTYRVIDPSELRSAWEPERDGQRCKALLLEILRRAAHDWVLYRQHKSMGKQELAYDAYTWLFEEDEDHALYRERLSAEIETSDGGTIRGSRTITSFLSVCEHLGLDPETVRERVKGMDVSQIIGSGRTSEQRRLRRDNSSVESHGVVADINVDSAYDNPHYESQYESYGSIATPSVLY